MRGRSCCFLTSASGLLLLIRCLYCITCSKILWCQLGERQWTSYSPARRCWPNYSIPKNELVNLQEQDDVLGRVFNIQHCRRPTRRERTDESHYVVKLLRYWPKLSVKDGMLYKIKKHRKMNMTVHQFVVPDSLKAQVLHDLHDSAGNQGQARMLSLARQRFFWIGMERDIINSVGNYFHCVVGKTLEPNDCAPLESICTSEPMELVCIDFWTADCRQTRGVWMFWLSQIILLRCPMHSDAKISQQSRLPVVSGMTSSAYIP